MKNLPETPPGTVWHAEERRVFSQPYWILYLVEPRRGLRPRRIIERETVRAEDVVHDGNDPDTTFRRAANAILARYDNQHRENVAASAIRNFLRR